jgi:mutator protein MutT
MNSNGVRGSDFIGVGVGAVIFNKRNEVLLLLREKKPEAGTWTIPGGAVEWFETCEDAIRRECREEVGLSIQIVRVLTVVNHIVKEDRMHWVSIEYLCSVVDGHATNLDLQESSKMRWFAIDALPTRLSQPTREALQSYSLGKSE